MTAWGYFDDDDGVFFRLNGTAFQVVVRSSTTGSPVETVIEQADFNGDKMDGSLGLSNLSNMHFDPSKLNVFWIDLQWLGGGRVRFGMLSEDGSRVTLHSVRNANALTGPYMMTATLPVRAEQFNSGVSASPSRLKVVCCTVHTEGEVVPDRKRRTNKYAGRVSATGVTTEVPIMSGRTAPTFNGVPTRKVTIPALFSAYVKTNAVRLNLYKNATLTGASFAQVPGSAVEVDTSASAISGGDLMLSWVLGPGGTNEHFPSNFGYLGQNLHLRADGGYGEVYTLAVESLEAGGSDIDLSVSWIDMG